MDTTKYHFIVYIKRSCKQCTSTTHHENYTTDVIKYHFKYMHEKVEKSAPVAPVMKIALQIRQNTNFGNMCGKVVGCAPYHQSSKFHYKCNKILLLGICTKKVEKSAKVHTIMKIALQRQQNEFFGYMCEKVRRSTLVSPVMKITLRNAT